MNEATQPRWVFTYAPHTNGGIVCVFTTDTGYHRAARCQAEGKDAMLVRMLQAAGLI